MLIVAGEGGHTAEVLAVVRTSSQFSLNETYFFVLLLS